MIKQKISHLLDENHIGFVSYLTTLSAEEYTFRYKQKWTAGQQLEHIRRSLKPLNLVMSFPKWVIRLYFGKSNRPSKSYEELVAKYRSKLGKVSMPAGYSPSPISFEQRESVSKSVLSLVKEIKKKLCKFSEKDLDVMILPHPLMGKVTFREMLFFTVYHVLHHQSLAKEYLYQKDI